LPGSFNTPLLGGTFMCCITNVCTSFPEATEFRKGAHRAPVAESGSYIPRCHHRLPPGESTVDFLATAIDRDLHSKHSNRGREER
jgi:hypothetical protein